MAMQYVGKSQQLDGFLTSWVVILNIENNGPKNGPNQLINK